MAPSYIVFCAICVTVLKEVNTLVDEPYMDEPFHIPQVQAYCNGDYWSWDPKITTPPGLYLWSLLLKKIFLFKCNQSMLRLTVLLSLLALPLVLTRILSFHQRQRVPSSLLDPTVESLIMAAFPVAWFFGFLYYTDVPSLVSVLLTVAMAIEDRHWLAGLFGIISCLFRQTNVIWVLYAFGISKLMDLRFQRALPGQAPPRKLHDPPALVASPVDLFRAIKSFPGVLPDILLHFVPYALALGLFGGFVVWNGGIVLGDKANHVPAIHIPQLYYFIISATAFAWPILVSSGLKKQTWSSAEARATTKEDQPIVVEIVGAVKKLGIDVLEKMLGTPGRIFATVIISTIMAITVKLFTIHHPFLLSDNRHYTFYVWRRVYMLHPVVPYLFIPLYIACAWAWWLRVGRDQTLLQTLLLPIFALPVLVPTPLLEPRYFLVPYMLLRSQLVDVPTWGLVLEGVWYALINAFTMGVFLYLPREGVGRFMW